MSAYVVSPDTVRLLIAVTDRYGLAATLRDIYPDRHISIDDSVTEDEARGMLMRYVLSVNVRAVMYRYPNDTLDTLPGWGYTYLDGMQYHPMPDANYEPVPFRVYDGHGSEVRKTLAPKIIGAAQCLNYQCCELPEWESTPAYRWLTRVIWRAAGALSDGWEIGNIRDVAA